MQRELVEPFSAFEVIPIDFDVTQALGTIPREQIPDMPDRIIAATAASLGVPLVTKDDRIRSSCIQTIW